MHSFIRLLALCLTIVLLLQPISPAFADSGNPNAEEDQRAQRIEYLLDQRQKIVHSDDADLVELNEIDVELHNLGVEFYSDAEAAVLFPDAMLSLPQNVSQQSIGDSDNVAQPAYDIEIGRASCRERV